jgi:uncharacterized protein (TIGR02145 family)
MNTGIHGGKRTNGGIRFLFAVLTAAVFCALGIAGCGDDSGGHIHSYGEWETVTSATCTAPGLESRTCGDCGHSENRTIPRLTGAGCGSGVVDGFFTDSRDGRRYRTLSMGYLTWFAENLNYAGHADGQSWCYDDNASNCARYGRLYDWSAAMSACPPGLNLPVRVNWSDLVTTAGGSNAAGRALKSKAPDWDGSDDYAFSALPGGFRNIDGFFSGTGANGNWWSATDGGGNAFSRAIFSGADNVREQTDDKGMGFSVRCVMRN